MTKDNSETEVAVMKEKYQLLAQLTELEQDYQKRKTALERRLAECNVITAYSEQGLDVEKISIAKTIIVVQGEYCRAGQDAASVVHDAIKQLVTGVPIRTEYSDLWITEFGTKNYDRWQGQRCDSRYGCGPRHGSVVFSVGLTPEVRKRSDRALTDQEILAAVYYLNNLAKIQATAKETCVS